MWRIIFRAVVNVTASPSFCLYTNTTSGAIKYNISSFKTKRHLQNGIRTRHSTFHYLSIDSYETVRLCSFMDSSSC